MIDIINKVQNYMFIFDTQIFSIYLKIERFYFLSEYGYSKD